MKRLMLFFVFFAGITARAFSQSDFFYANGGERVYFKFKKDRVILRAKSATEAKSLSPQSGFLSGYNVDEKIIISTIDTLQVRLEDFKQKTDFTDVAYALEYEDGIFQYPSYQIFVSFKDGQSSDKVLNSVGLEGRVQAIELFDSNNSIYLIKLDVDLENILKICRNLYESGFCKFAEPSFFREMKAHNPYYANQWGLKNTGQYGGIIGIDINAEQAWSVTKGNSNIKVAVIDEGVDLTHPDLQANLLQGYDATVNAPGGANGSPWSSNAHGTSCAGIVASCDNNIGVLGVASKVKIIPIRIAYDYSNNGLWTTNDVWIVNGIKYAWQTAGADVLSNSWGGGSVSTTINTTVNNAVTLGRGGKGSIVVFATGNNDASTIIYPAYLPNVIAVGAMSPCGERKSKISCDGETWWGGNYGTNLSVVAPGVLISTTDIQGNNGYNYNAKPNDYADRDYTKTFNGTSAACPHVAGVAALILSVNPCLTRQEVKDIIESTAQKTGSYTYLTTAAYPNGAWNNEMGYGLVDAESALQKTVNITLQNHTETGYQLIASPKTIRAGYNVDPTRPAGNYVVASGANVTLRAGESISLEPGFTAEAGSTFVAEIKPMDCANAAKTADAPLPRPAHTQTEAGQAAALAQALTISPQFFPNPYTNAVYVRYELAQAETVRIQLYDISGKMIDDQTFNGHAGVNTHCINEKISGNETVLIAQFCVQGSCESFKLVKK